MKKYTNLIVLGVIALAAAVFLMVKYVSLSDVLYKIGYYDEKISVINTGDIHGHIVFDDESGGYYSQSEVDVMMGMPLVKHLADGFKKENPNALFLDSGDMFHGTNEANVEKAQGVVDVANLMGYDAMTPGNHDFDFGLDRLMEIKSQLKFPMLSANIMKDGKPLFKEYEIVNVGGKKVALFGLTVQDALSYTNSRDTHGVTLEDPVKISAKLVPELRKKADIVILVSHLGDDIDKELIKKVDGIDLVLSGHHHFLYEKAEKINNTYIAEAGGYSTHVGLANIYLKDNKVAKIVWKVFHSNESEKADKKLVDTAEKYHKIALESAKEVVGKSKEKLDGYRARVRMQETTLGDLLSDAMREVGKADLALMNGGGIRESIPEGDINLYKIGKSLPFINSLVTIELGGDKIYEALERGIRQYPNGSSNGGFLQVSGIKYEFDASKPAGKRIVRILKDGVELDRNKTYLVATNDYLYNGGDNYEEFVDAKLVSKGELLKDVLSKYIKSKGEVSPVLEGRIKVVNERYK